MGSACSRCGGAPPNPNQDTTLKVDVNQRLEAANRRRKSMQRKHEEARHKAKKISDTALEEKERLSMSVRSSRHKQNGIFPINTPITTEEKVTKQSVTVESANVVKRKESERASVAIQTAGNGSSVGREKQDTGVGEDKDDIVHQSANSQVSSEVTEKVGIEQKVSKVEESDIKQAQVKESSVEKQKLEESKMEELKSEKSEEVEEVAITSLPHSPSGTPPKTSSMLDVPLTAPADQTTSSEDQSINAKPVVSLTLSTIEGEEVDLLTSPTELSSKVSDATEPTIGPDEGTKPQEESEVVELRDENDGSEETQVEKTMSEMERDRLEEERLIAEILSSKPSSQVSIRNTDSNSSAKQNVEVSPKPSIKLNSTGTAEKEKSQLSFSSAKSTEKLDKSSTVSPGSKADNELKTATSSEGKQSSAKAASYQSETSEVTGNTNSPLGVPSQTSRPGSPYPSQGALKSKSAYGSKITTLEYHSVSPVPELETMATSPRPNNSDITKPQTPGDQESTEPGYQDDESYDSIILPSPPLQSPVEFTDMPNESALRPKVVRSERVQELIDTADRPPTPTPDDDLAAEMSAMTEARLTLSILSHSNSQEDTLAVTPKGSAGNSSTVLNAKASAGSSASASLQESASPFPATKTPHTSPAVPLSSQGSKSNAEAESLSQRISKKFDTIKSDQSGTRSKDISTSSLVISPPKTSSISVKGGSPHKNNSSLSARQGSGNSQASMKSAKGSSANVKSSSTSAKSNKSNIHSNGSSSKQNSQSILRNGSKSSKTSTKIEAGSKVSVNTKKTSSNVSSSNKPKLSPRVSAIKSRSKPTTPKSSAISVKSRSSQKSVKISTSKSSPKATPIPSQTSISSERKKSVEDVHSACGDKEESVSITEKNTDDVDASASVEILINSCSANKLSEYSVDVKSVSMVDAAEEKTASSEDKSRQTAWEDSNGKAPSEPAGTQQTS